jgi:hypothetical protein
MSTEKQNEQKHLLEPHHFNSEFWHSLYLSVSNRSTEYVGLLGKSIGLMEGMIHLLQDSDQRKYFENQLLEIRKSLSDIGINAD